jgi:hypothetical protein
LSNRVDGEHQCAGGVIDDQRVLCSGNVSQQIATVIGSAAPAAGRQVEFQVAVAGTDLLQRAKCGICEWRTAQIGVEHHTGAVQYRLQAGLGLLHETIANLIFPAFRGTGPPSPCGFDGFTDRRDDGRAGRRLEKGLDLRLVQEPID